MVFFPYHSLQIDNSLHSLIRSVDVEIMNCYLTAETLRSKRNDLPFCFSLRRRKAKSVHLRWVGFLKAMSCSIIAYFGLLQPQFQLPSVIAAYQSRPVRRGLSVPPPAGKKDILLRVLCASSKAPERRDFRNAPTRGDVLHTHLPA